MDKNIQSVYRTPNGYCYKVLFKQRKTRIGKEEFHRIVRQTLAQLADSTVEIVKQTSVPPKYVGLLQVPIVTCMRWSEVVLAF